MTRTKSELKKSIDLRYSEYIGTIEYISFLFSIDIVKQKGLENITVDELVQEITPKGRGKH